MEDLTNSSNLNTILDKVKPDEVYNLAAWLIKEKYLLTGLLEYTNELYTIAKIMSIIICQSYRKQYGVNIISAIPTNLYGINDNFDLNNPQPDGIPRKLLDVTKLNSLGCKSRLSLYDGIKITYDWYKQNVLKNI